MSKHHDTDCHHDHHDHHSSQKDRDQGSSCRCCCCGQMEKHPHHRDRDDDQDGQGEHGGGTTVGWKNPGRPGRTVGTSSGEVPGGALQPGNFDDRPPNQWPGQRGDLFLPFLFMRANPGDLGARPVVGPFWESPDILVLAGVDPGLAPPVPPALGQTALAEAPNTLYAHVWNFGLAQAPNVVVEWYWCDPSLGIGPSGAHLVGQTMVSLGARGSGQSHAVVKCPESWTPTFVNGGHECLVVRVWDETSDGLGGPPWDASLNRHVAQRNIHVLAAGEQHAFALAGPLVLLPPAVPLTIKVGPLYGEGAQVTVERAAPHEMPWLQLRTGVRGQFPAPAAATGGLVLSAPRTIGGGTAFGSAAGTQHVVGDDQQLTFDSTDAAPAPGQAHVYRVTASQQGQVFGGYTVVVLG